MKNFIFFLFLCFSIIFTTGASAQQISEQQEEKGIKFEHAPWTQVLEKAQKEGRMIFMDAYASWCSPCKWMAKNVFTNDTVAQFYNGNFINVKIDMEKGEGLEIAKKYGVKAYPTFLYISSAGEMLHRTCGSTEVAGFIENGKNALNPEKQVAGYMKKFGNGNTDATSAYQYFMALEGACMEYQDEVSKYFNNLKDEELTSEGNWRIISTFLQDANSSAFRYVLKNRKQYSDLYTEMSVNNMISKIYQSALINCLKQKDMKGYERLKTEIKASVGNYAPGIILNVDMKLYKKNKEWKKYASAADELLKKSGMKDYNLMNEAAWTVYENCDDKALLKKAEKWSKKAVELNSNYALNDTYAAVLYKIGKYSEAGKVAEKAIEIGKKANEDTQETELLLEKIKSRLKK